MNTAKVHRAAQPAPPRPAATDPRADETLARVRGEFAEMPGLCLTAAQATRLFGLSAGLCEEVLERLVASGFLVEANGTFRRPGVK